MTGSPEYIGREVRIMTAADIILIFIGSIGLLISFGSLIVAFLTFLDKRSKIKMPNLSANRLGGAQ